MSRLIVGMIDLSAKEPKCRDRAMKAAENADNWLNCMLATAAALSELGSVP